MQAAQALAHELGTTTNDAIVRLAEERIAASERRWLVERLARESREAVAGVGFADAMSFPAPDELRRAILSGRREP